MRFHLPQAAIILPRPPLCPKRDARRGPVSKKREKKDIFYLQPASLSRRAYILPMSPMPMMPTMKDSMSGGTMVAAVMIAISGAEPTDLQREPRRVSPGSHSPRRVARKARRLATRSRRAAKQGLARSNVLPGVCPCVGPKKVGGC